MQTSKAPLTTILRPAKTKRRVALCLAGLLWVGMLVLFPLYAKPEPGRTKLSIKAGNALSARGSVAVLQPHGPVNVNTATAEELIQLDAVGPVLAEEIIRERELNGPFYYREDLLNVKGIGEKKLLKLDGQFCLD